MPPQLVQVIRESGPIQIIAIIISRKFGDGVVHVFVKWRVKDYARSCSSLDLLTFGNEYFCNAASSRSCNIFISTLSSSFPPLSQVNNLYIYLNHSEFESIPYLLITLPPRSSSLELSLYIYIYVCVCVCVLWCTFWWSGNVQCLCEIKSCHVRESKCPWGNSLIWITRVYFLCVGLSDHDFIREPYNVKVPSNWALTFWHSSSSKLSSLARYCYISIEAWSDQKSHFQINFESLNQV